MKSSRCDKGSCDKGDSPILADTKIGTVPLSILLLGDTDRAEFDDARQCLERWGDVARFCDADAAAAVLAGGSIVPGVIVVAQAFPGQFSHAAVDRLRRLAPLTPVVGLMGSWCEGELRTGSPWPGTVRSYWHQWSVRCDRELRRLAEGMPGAWTLPMTATEEERLLTDTAGTSPQRHGLVPEPTSVDRWGRHSCPPHSSIIAADRNVCPTDLSTRQFTSAGALVVISARSPEMADWLAAACRSRGFATVWQRGTLTASIRGAAAAIFDDTDGSGNRWNDLARFATKMRPAPVVALLAFPRIEDRRSALAAGAAAVVSKPLLLDDLFGQLDEVAECVRWGRHSCLP